MCVSRKERYKENICVGKRDIKRICASRTERYKENI